MSFLNRSVTQLQVVTQAVPNISQLLQPVSLFDENGNPVTLGGGGLNPDGTVYNLEYTGESGPQTIPDNNGVQILWDTWTGGIEPVTPGIGTNFILPEGIYIASYDIEPSQPAEQRVGKLSFPNSLTPSMWSTIYPIVLSPTDTFEGYGISGQILVGGNISFDAVLKFSTLAGSGGADLNLDYAGLKLTKLV